MKEMEIKNLKGLSEFLHLKQTITQLLISVSIISLVFSLSSSTLLYSQNLHYFSSNSFHPMSIAMNKNYIFLIFNGILVFLAKTSTLAPPPPASEPDDMLHKGIIANDDFQVEITEAAETLISDKHIVLDESPLATEKDEDEGKNEDEDEENEDEDAKAEEREDQEFDHSNESAVQVMIAIDDGSEDDENELQNCCLFDGRDEEGSNGGEEVDEIEKLSNEELNKKFEDFIKRMKEEFRINQYQQKQLVLVK